MPPPAHRALQIFDVIHEILLHYQPSSDHRQDLARIARVNRIFSQIALDLLWQELDDIAYAFKLFSAFEGLPVQEHEHEARCDSDRDIEGGDEPAYYDLGSDIPPDEWTLFRRYARRVRKLRLDFGASPTSGTEVLARLTSLNPRCAPLFPELRSVEWVRSSLSDTSLEHLVCSSLRKINFIASKEMQASLCGQYPEDDSLKSLLRTVFSIASPQVIRFHYGLHPSSLVPSLWTQNLTYIKLECDPLDIELFTVLQSLENLKTLLLITGSVGPRDDELVLPTGFKFLKNLAVTAHPSVVLRLFASIGSSSLEWLSIETYDGVTRGTTLEWHKCLSAISAQSAASLKRFFLNIAMDDPPELECPSFAAFSRPLLSAHGLNTLEIEILGCGRMHWEEQDLLEFATGCPGLTSFTFRFGEDTRDPDAPAVLEPRVIEEFVRLCPNLHTLILPKVNMRHAYQPYTTPIKAPLLEILEFGYRRNTLVQNPLALMYYLVCLAPKLNIGHYFVPLKHESDLDEDSGNITPAPEVDPEHVDDGLASASENGSGRDEDAASASETTSDFEDAAIASEAGPDIEDETGYAGDVDSDTTDENDNRSADTSEFADDMSTDFDGEDEPRVSPTHRIDLLASVTRGDSSLSASDEDEASGVNETGLTGTVSGRAESMFEDPPESDLEDETRSLPLEETRFLPSDDPCYMVGFPKLGSGYYAWPPETRYVSYSRGDFAGKYECNARSPTGEIPSGSEDVICDTVNPESNAGTLDDAPCPPHDDKPESNHCGQHDSGKEDTDQHDSGKEGNSCVSEEQSGPRNTIHGRYVDDTLTLNVADEPGGGDEALFSVAFK